MFRPSPTVPRFRAKILSRAWCFLAIALVVSPARTSGRNPAEGATITFRKIFKSSYPEFVEIKVNENGSATYDIRQLDEPPSPVAFEVSPTLIQKIFSPGGKWGIDASKAPVKAKGRANTE
jgi:hypothetical protein